MDSFHHSLRKHRASRCLLGLSWLVLLEFQTSSLRSISLSQMPRFYKSEKPGNLALVVHGDYFEILDSVST
jgi:hypothetical protein